MRHEGKIILGHLDGKLPNLALMQVGSYFRSLGYFVELRRWKKIEDIQPELGDDLVRDRVFASAIFAKSRPLVDAVSRQFPGAIIGGTGSGNPSTLADYGIPDTSPDYSLYPDYTASIGFSQRGCRLKCSFCVVPTKEGSVQDTNTISRIWRGEPHPRHIVLLDNDFFGQPQWREKIQEIRDGDFRVNFTQGINVRMINTESAAALASIHYSDSQFRRKRLYTAWDNRKDEARVRRGIETLIESGIPGSNITVYMLVGYWPIETIKDCLHRQQVLREYGCDPYPMPYTRTPELVGFQRWVVGHYDRRIPWQDWKANNYRPEGVKKET